MNETEVNIRDYLRILHKRRYTIYTFFIITFAIVIIGTIAITPKYTASIKLLIEKNEPNPITGRYVYHEYNPEFLETQYQIIKSKSVLEKVVEILSLDDRYKSYFLKDLKKSSILELLFDFKKGLIKLIKFKKKDSLSENVMKDTNIKTDKDKITEILSKHVELNPLRNSSIAKVSYTSKNPVLSKMIVNTLAEAYIEQILEMNMQSTNYSVKWMKEKADEERVKLESSEKRLQEYMKRNNIITIENRIAVIPEKLSELSTQVTRAETKKKELEVLYNKTKNLSNNPKNSETLKFIASDPTIQSLRLQMLKARRYIAELSKKYGKKHPQMKKAIEDLKILNQKRKQEINRVVKTQKNEYELALSNEESLKNLLLKTKGEAIRLNEKFIQYRILEREVGANRLLYDALIKKIKEKRVTEQSQRVNVLIVEKADTPEFPSSPKKLLNILLGTLVGLFGGVGLAFFVEYLDNTIKTPDDAEAKLNINVLGMIPYIEEKNKQLENMVLNEPASVFAENIKTVRMSILLSSTESHPKKILVTSISPGEGKTTIATNIGSALAQSDYNVLIVDCDLRKPRIHKIFGSTNTSGISNYLTSTSDMDIIQRGPIEKLSYISAGPVPPNPSELLTSERLRRLINSLSDKFDFIIIDSPPVLTVSDSLLLSRICDSTILVVKGGSTTYELAKRGIKSLQDHKSNIIGMLINAVNIRKSDYYYYSYQGYYSSYLDESKT